MVVGGVAMAAYGSTRTTHDTDLLVDDQRRRELFGAVGERGFRVLFDCDGFTNLRHADPEIGDVDFLWADAATSTAVFGAALEVRGPDGLPLLVASAEHLIAMKVRAIKNKPIRVLRDAEDIRLLLSLPKTDQNAAREAFVRVGMPELYTRLKTTP